MIDKEDFDAWRDNPITERVFATLDELAERAKQRWVEVSWGGGSADPLLLADLRARAEVIRDLRNISYEDIDEE